MTKKTRLATTRFHRRQHPRINLTLPVEYTMEEASARQFSRSGNLGGGGLMLFLPVPVPIGSLMELKIHFPNHRSVACVVKVVWMELMTGLEQRDYRTGVMFERISDQELQTLTHFIKEQMNPFDPLPLQIREYLDGRSTE